MDFFEKLGETFENIKKISDKTVSEGVDAVGDSLKAGKNKNIVRPLNDYSEVLGYDPSASENDLPSELGPIGKRKEKAMKETKEVENYYRILSYINNEIEDIL